jgi:hypothetical protein
MMVISVSGVWRLRRALVVAVLLGAHTWLVPANGLPQDLENRDVERAVDAIAAGIDTWLSRLRFYCSFEIYVAEAASFDDALAEQYRQHPKLQCRGEYAVGDGVVRHRLENLEGDVGPGVSPFFESHDAARNMRNNFTLVCRGTCLAGLPNKQFPPIAPEAPVAYGGFNKLNPCIVWANPERPNVIRYFRQDQKSGAHGERMEWQITVPNPQEQRLLLVRTGKVGDQEWKSADEFVLHRGSPYPKIVRVNTLATEAGNPPWPIRGIEVYEKFAKVGEVEIATQVRVLIQYVRKTAEGQYVPAGVGLRIWRAKELRLPRHEDFLIRVPAATSVDCVRYTAMPPVRDGYRTFDVTRMTVEDIECFDPEVMAATAPPQRTRWWLWVAVGTLVVLVLVSGSVYSWARRKKRSGA